MRKRTSSRAKKSRSSPLTTTKKSRTDGALAVAFVSLGSNLGNRRRNLDRAKAGLTRIGRLTAESSVRETAPVGFRRQPLFLNAVVRLETELSPSRLLVELRRIERTLGRRRTVRNGPRLIDIDLLDYSGLRLRTARLTLPHPRLSRRRFVVEPLAEIAPDWRHPSTGKSARQMLARMNRR